MLYTFSCQHCDRRLETPERFALRWIACPACEEPLVVPEPDDADDGPEEGGGTRETESQTGGASGGSETSGSKSEGSSSSGGPGETEAKKDDDRKDIRQDLFKKALESTKGGSDAGGTDDASRAGQNIQFSRQARQVLSELDRHVVRELVTRGDLSEGQIPELVERVRKNKTPNQERSPLNQVLVDENLVSHEDLGKALSAAMDRQSETADSTDEKQNRISFFMYTGTAAVFLFGLVALGMYSGIIPMFGTSDTGPTTDPASSSDATASSGSAETSSGDDSNRLPGPRASVATNEESEQENRETLADIEGDIKKLRQSEEAGVHMVKRSEHVREIVFAGSFSPVDVSGVTTRGKLYYRGNAVENASATGPFTDQNTIALRLGSFSSTDQQGIKQLFPGLYRLEMTFLQPPLRPGYHVRSAIEPYLEGSTDQVGAGMWSTALYFRWGSAREHEQRKEQLREQVNTWKKSVTKPVESYFSLLNQSLESGHRPGEEEMTGSLSRSMDALRQVNRGLDHYRERFARLPAGRSIRDLDTFLDDLKHQLRRSARQLYEGELNQSIPASLKVQSGGKEAYQRPLSEEIERIPTELQERFSAVEKGLTESDQQYVRHRIQQEVQRLEQLYHLVDRPAGSASFRRKMARKSEAGYRKFWSDLLEYQFAVLNVKELLFESAKTCFEGNEREVAGRAVEGKRRRIIRRVSELSNQLERNVPDLPLMEPGESDLSGSFWTENVVSTFLSKRN